LQKIDIAFISNYKATKRTKPQHLQHFNTSTLSTFSMATIAMSCSNRFINIYYELLKTYVLISTDYLQEWYSEINWPSVMMAVILSYILMAYRMTYMNKQTINVTKTIRSPSPKRKTVSAEAPVVVMEAAAPVVVMENAAVVLPTKKRTGCANPDFLKYYHLNKSAYTENHPDMTVREVYAKMCKEWHTANKKTV